MTALKITCGSGGSSLWERRQKRKGSLAVCTEVNPSVPSIDEIRDAYDLEKLLGRGSVGMVYKARRPADGRKVVVKLRSVIDKEVARCCRQEFEVLRRLSHPNIITAIDFLEQQNEAALVFEYCCDMTLQSMVKQSFPGGFPSATLKPLSKMLCDAVGYLHKRRIVHRDIKPENVLVSDSLTSLWLADFNTAYQLMDGWALTMTGTRDYSAPEVLQDESPSEKADIWSLGLSLHFMAVGKLPRRLGDFQDLSAFCAAVLKPVQFSQPEWHPIDESFKAILRRCLAIEKSARPASMELLQSAFFQELMESENEDNDDLAAVCRTRSV